MLMMPEATVGKERYNMFDTVKIGKRIAELRKKRDMTQFEIADRLGISYQAVSNWERMSAGRPSQNFLLTMTA